jgi:branched-chain amino acid transport system permease protein
VNVEPAGPDGREVRHSLVNYGPWLCLAALLGVGWLGLGAIGTTQVTVIVLALYYAIGGASFNFLYGTIGVFSLAQPVFLAVGGYTSAYMYSTHGLSPWVALPMSMAVAGLLALPIGYLALRRGGTVLTALVTLIIAEAAPPILAAVKPLGGSIGLYIRLRPGSDFAAMQFSAPVTFARIFLVFNVAVMGLIMLFGRSRFGLWASAVRDAPGAASSSGVPVLRVRLAVFVAAAMIAAPAGAIYSQYNLLVNADLFLGATTLFQVIVVALVGGSARPWGSFVGAMLVTELSYYVTKASNGRPGVAPLTFAGVFLVVALLVPRGLSATWDRLVRSRHGPGPPPDRDAVPASAAGQVQATTSR